MMYSRARPPTMVDNAARRFYASGLKAKELVQMAISISERLNMGIADRQRLLKRLEQGLVTIYSGADHTLWVDRQYIAVTTFWKDRLVYLYLTRQHVYEEMASDKEAYSQRGRHALDPAIRKQFAAAWTTMQRTWKDYAVRLLGPDKGEHPSDLDLEAPWT